MSNYLYFQQDNQPLQNRFNSNTILREEYAINGLEDWRRLISYLLAILNDEENQTINENQNIRTIVLNELIEISGNDNFDVSEQGSIFPDERSTEELTLVLLIARLRKFYHTLPKNRCPRLFISHRQIDKKYALRIAELAAKHKFAYWVDVIDPDLEKLSKIESSASLSSLLTACIIEMALINCTHVIACMTPNSRGSLWMPYEYGRITELPALSSKACAWSDPNLDSSDFPDYMHLGKKAKNEKEIEAWLENELLKSKKTCNPDKGDLAAFEKVDMLPEISDKERTKIREEAETTAHGLPVSIAAPDALKMKTPPKSN